MQAPLDMGGKCLCIGLRHCTAAQKSVASALRFTRIDDVRVLQPQCRSKAVIYASRRTVQICMGVDCRNAVFRQIKQHTSRRRCIIDRLQVPNCRMMCQQKLAAQLFCLHAHRQKRIECYQYPCDLTVKVSAKQSDMVPFIRHRFRCNYLYRLVDFLDSSHIPCPLWYSSAICFTCSSAV